MSSFRGCVLCRAYVDDHGEGHHAADCPTRQAPSQSAGVSGERKMQIRPDGSVTSSTATNHVMGEATSQPAGVSDDALATDRAGFVEPFTTFIMKYLSNDLTMEQVRTAAYALDNIVAAALTAERQAHITAEGAMRAYYIGLLYEARTKLAAAESTHREEMESLDAAHKEASDAWHKWAERAKEAEAKLAAAESMSARWKKSIEGLTPGGSEFVDNPEYCAAYIRKRCEYPSIITKLREQLVATESSRAAAITEAREAASEETMTKCDATFDQLIADRDAALVAMVEKCADEAEGCQREAKWFKDEKRQPWEIYNQAVCEAAKLIRVILPADILASVARDRQRLQLEARIAGMRSAMKRWETMPPISSVLFASKVYGDIAALEAELAAQEKNQDGDSQKA